MALSAARGGATRWTLATAWAPSAACLYSRCVHTSCLQPADELLENSQESWSGVAQCSGDCIKILRTSDTYRRCECGL
jgi:hypothetical protein